MEEAWFMHTINKNCDPSIILEFNDWLKVRAAEHERMKLSSGKPKTENSIPSAILTKTKSGTEIFTSTDSTSQTQSIGIKAENPPDICITLVVMFCFSQKKSYPADELGCRQQTLFFKSEWAKFVP